MENLPAKFISTAAGVSSSLAGLLTLSRCSAGNCSSCFGCAGAGVGILMLAVITRLKGRRKKEEENGMA